MDKHVFNLFRIENLPQLQTEYRLIDVDGEYGANVGDGDLADRNLQLLVKLVAIRERRPVALIRGDEGVQLAVPASLTISQTEYSLTPEFVRLRPQNETHPLNFSRLSGRDARIALGFLRFHLRNGCWTATMKRRSAA